MAVDLLTLRETLERTGLSRRTLFRYRVNGSFPAPVRINDHNVLFLSTDVDAWLRERGLRRRVHRDP